MQPLDPNAGVKPGKQDESDVDPKVTANQNEVAETLNSMGLDPSAIHVGGQQQALIDNAPPLEDHHAGGLEELEPAQVPGLGDQLPQAEQEQNLKLKVSLPGADAPVDWHPPASILGDGQAKLARDPKSEIEMDDLTAMAQAKVNRGAKIYAQLQHSAVDLSDKDASALVWYLQACAETKTGNAGAPETVFSLPDPHGHVLRSLDETRTTGGDRKGLAYQRNSSHLTGFQTVPGGSGAARGVDLRWDAKDPSNTNTLLPYGKATILYQKLDYQNLVTGRDANQPDRIFIKPESHGMYKSKPRVPDPHGPSRDELPHDKSDAMGHSMGFFGSTYRKVTGSNSPAGSNKERIPPQMAKDYKAIVKSTAKIPGAKAILSRDNPTDNSSGLRIMKRNLDALETHLRTEQAGHISFDDLGPMHAFREKYLSGGRYDQPDVRIGQEVIL